MRNLFYPHWLLAPLTLVALVSCGDDADPGTADASSGNACLQGSWDCTLPDSSTAEMTISGGAISGSFTQSSVTATVNSTITVDGSSMSVVDTGGTGACPDTQVGEYNFSCSTSDLSFNRVRDLCLGRSNFFGCAWTRR